MADPQNPLDHPASGSRVAKKEGSQGLNRAVFSLVLYIVVYVIMGALINDLLTSLLPDVGYHFPAAYLPYVNILLALGFGYMIVSAFSNVVYWSVRVGLPHSTAAAFRSMSLKLSLTPSSAVCSLICVRRLTRSVASTLVVR